MFRKRLHRLSLGVLAAAGFVGAQGRPPHFAKSSAKWQPGPMNPWRAIALLGFVGLALPACRDGEARRSASTPAAHAASGEPSGHDRPTSSRSAAAVTGAAKAAVTGAANAAAADWCAGHGLPESKCTQCNPELIPQLRAAGDWCEAHRFPESACPTCNPQAPPGAVNAPLADWCVEHGLPESKCTQCNPELIPQFRAAGDLCAEHGFPESVCPV